MKKNVENPHASFDALRGLHWVPSASFYPAHGGIGMYLKYGKTGINNIEVKAENGEYVWIVAPDREILVVGGDNSNNSIRPLDSNWDEYVSLSPYFNTWDDTGISSLMTNYPQHLTGVDRSPNHVLSPQTRKTRWFSDSGGFQIFQGRIDYLDPKEVVEWYNKNTDFGIVLDIPTVITHHDLLIRSAYVQKANTDAMMPYKAKNLDLINIVHGRNIKDYREYHKIVYNENLKRICIADSYRGDIISGVADTSCFISEHNETYKHFHLLGVYNLKVLTALFRLNKLGIANLVTSDSSTHIQSAMGKLYHHQSNAHSPEERMIYGVSYRAKVKEVTPHRHLPCSCPVCSRLKYVDILSVLTGALPPFLLMNHNMFEIDRYVKMMNDLSDQMDDKQWRDLVKDQLRGDNQSRATLKALDFLEALAQDGVDKARKKFSAYLSENQLLSSPPVYFDLNGTEIKVEDDNEWVEKIDGILKKYESNIEKSHGKRKKVQSGKHVVFSRQKKQKGIRVKKVRS